MYVWKIVMVKDVHVTLDDEDYERLKDLKDKLDLTWRELLFRLLESGEKD